MNTLTTVSPQMSVVAVSALDLSHRAAMVSAAPSDARTQGGLRSSAAGTDRGRRSAQCGRGRQRGALTRGEGTRGVSASLLRLSALTIVVAAALLALSVSSASAATAYKDIGEITGPEAGVPFGLLKSEAVAVNDKNGHIYVADSSDGTVYEFESLTDASGTVFTGAAIGTGSVAVAVDDNSGDLYVADSAAGVIRQYSAAGVLVRTLDGSTTPAGSFSPPAIEGSFGIAVDQETGDLYAIDAGHGVVDVFSSSGEFLPSQPQFGTEPEAFGCSGAYTDGVAVNDKSAELLISNSCSVHSYRFELSTGTFIAAIDGSETPQHEFGGGYTSVGVDNQSGDLYITATSFGVVDRFDQAARYQDQITGTPRGSFGAVAIDQESGDIYVAENEAHKITIFEAVPLPDATVAKASPIGPTTATLRGTVNPNGVPLKSDPAEGCFFEWGETEAYGEIAPCAAPDAEEVGEGNIPVAVHADLVGLQPGAVYHFRLIAANADGTGKSADQALATGASIDSTSVSAVTATSAVLETEINPHGLPTNLHFEYDTAPYAEGEGPHGTPTATQSAGSGETDVARSAPIGGLAPNTTYHYRVVATNTLGTSVGPDRSFTTQGAFASLLPDSRGWELVSPPEKHGASLEAIAREGGVIQTAADGSAITYFASSPPGAETAGSRSQQNSQLLSLRSTTRWSTQDLATPHQGVVGLVPGNPSEYKLFSTDLSLGALEPFGATPLSPQTTEKTPYLRRPDGTYLPMVTEANVPAGVEFGGTEVGPEQFEFGVNFVTATPDLSHLLLKSRQPLTSGLSGFGFENIFEWSAGALSLLSQIPPAPATTCGGSSPACLPAGELSTVGVANNQVRNAISADGSRVVFGIVNQVEERKIYLRDLARGETVQLDAAEAGCVSCESGQGTFQTAGTDGSRIFFTDSRHLTQGSTAAGLATDLYMCQIEVDGAGHLACDLTDLTANTLNAAEPADVQGAVIGAAEDGGSLYFVANGALTSGAVHGDCASNVGVGSGECNLYRYDTATETTSLVAVLSGRDFPDWAGQSPQNLGFLTSRVSPDGRYLAFMSSRPLTGYDNRDAKTGVRDQEVFLYDSQAPPADALLCASCNPSGARPRGVFDDGQFPGLLVDRPANWKNLTLAANIPGWTKVALPSALYQSRYLSDSGRLFFNAADALVPQDSNGTFDVYEFEFPQGPGQPASNTCTAAASTYSPNSGGCVSLITSGTSPEESAFMDASESGDDVFFLTASRLTPKDVDTAPDLYDARVGGGEAEVVKPVECSGDACQQPAVPPNDPTPGSLTFSGAGNVVQCPKGKVKKSGKCVKKQSKKKHSKKHKKHHKKSKQKSKSAGRQKQSHR
jgi:hypothetical protein